MFRASEVFGVICLVLSLWTTAAQLIQQTQTQRVVRWAVGCLCMRTGFQ